MLPASDESNDILNCKIAEYAKAVIQGRPNFHISLVIDVSPYCDCHGENDAAIVPNVGMFASFDPVALDVACADAVNAQPVIQNSKLETAGKKNGKPIIMITFTASSLKPTGNPPLNTESL